MSTWQMKSRNRQLNASFLFSNVTLTEKRNSFFPFTEPAYISVNVDGTPVYGAYFSHQGETPGLGAEIATPHFSEQFKEKQLFKDGEFKSIAVQKKGQKPLNGEDYVDAISGGTITSKGVQSMLQSCLSCYAAFLQSQRNTNN